MAEGKMELESGAWSWRVEDLAMATGSYVAGLRPAGEADSDTDIDAERVDENGHPVLVLEDPENPDHWMVRALPTVEGEPTEQELQELARDPDLRQIVDDDGRLWRLERMEKPDAVRETAEFDRSSPKIMAASEGGPERLVSLPEGARLGTLKRDALLQAVRH